MLITELRQISEERCIIGFSDGSEIKTNISVAAEIPLFKGRELTEEEYSALLEASSLANAKARALRIIGARPMSEKTLADRLIEKGETEENAAECVRWLREMRYIDDGQYACMVARHYSAKGYGAGKIKNELYRRGVPGIYWDAALEELEDGSEKLDKLLRMKLKSDDPDRADLKRATDALFRRGYAWDEIKAAVERMKNGGD